MSAERVVARVSPQANGWAVWADVWFPGSRVVSHWVGAFDSLRTAQLVAAAAGVELSGVVERFVGDAAVQMILEGEQLALCAG